MSLEYSAAVRAPEVGFLSHLAKFFPNAAPVRISAQLTRLDGPGAGLTEAVVIEYGTATEILFASTSPWEFADRLQLRNRDGSLDVQASVVAVQYQNGKTAVAARFSREVPNWIVKP